MTVTLRTFERATPDANPSIGGHMMDIAGSRDIEKVQADRIVRHRHAEIDGIGIFYREAGPEGAPVLLLPHGYPCSSFEFRNFMPALADRWRLIAADFPGFGYSDTPEDSPTTLTAMPISSTSWSKR